VLLRFHSELQITILN